MIIWSPLTCTNIDIALVRRRLIHENVVSTVVVGHHGLELEMSRPMLNHGRGHVSSSRRLLHYCLAAVRDLKLCYCFLIRQNHLSLATPGGARGSQFMHLEIRVLIQVVFLS